MIPPTDAELKLLNVLWERGPATVRQVHETAAEPDKSYTTTLKQLQLMLDKGLVTRDDSSRSHVYRAAVSQAKTQGKLLDALLDSAFGGSTRELFVRALSRKKASQADLEDIRNLLDELEGK